MAYYDYDRVQGHIREYEFRMAKYQFLPIEINSYADALDWWKRRDGEDFKGSSDRPVAKREWSHRRMRMRSDGSIEFEDSNHVLAVWHPDKTLTIDPFPTVRYGAFERFVVPRTLEVGLGTRSGKVIYLKPGDIDIRSRIKMETDTGVKCSINPDILVVRAENPVNLKLDRSSHRWEPTHEHRLKAFEWFELNKGELRKASVRYNIPEFVSAITAALQMGAEIKTSTAYSSDGVAKSNAAGEDILTLLEQQRFVEAAALVRPAEERHYDTATGKWVTETKGLSSTDIRKIRHIAYEEMGLLYLEQETIVTLPQFNNIERKLKDFGVPVTDCVL